VRTRARALIAILQARGLAVPRSMRSRILACADTAMLDRWIARAATARNADEVMAEG
jgi:hypothetical protein